MTFTLREIKHFSYFVYGRRRLLHEDLNGRVGDDGFAVVGTQKVANVLSNGGKAEIIFAGAFGDGVHKIGGVRVFHKVPSFIDNKETLFEVSADAIPNIVEDDK